jgi:hypothetical protein
MTDEAQAMVAVEQELPPIAAEPTTADAIPSGLRRSGGTPRQVFVLTLIGALVLGVFASGDLASWLDRMGSGPLLEPLQHAAAAWDGAMQRFGLNVPADWLRATIHRLLDWRWDGLP